MKYMISFFKLPIIDFVRHGIAFRISVKMMKMLNKGHTECMSGVLYSTDTAFLF